MCLSSICREIADAKRKIKRPGIKHRVVMYFQACMLIMQVKIPAVKGRKKTAPEIAFMKPHRIINGNGVTHVVVKNQQCKGLIVVVFKKHHIIDEIEMPGKGTAPIPAGNILLHGHGTEIMVMISCRPDRNRADATIRLFSNCNGAFNFGPWNAQKPLVKRNLAVIVRIFFFVNESSGTI